LFFSRCSVHQSFPSFPTRRSSDLVKFQFSIWVRNATCGCTSQPTYSASPPPIATTPRKGKCIIQPSRKESPVKLIFNAGPNSTRSEEHTSELQSRENLVCRLLLEK